MRSVAIVGCASFVFLYPVIAGQWAYSGHYFRPAFTLAGSSCDADHSVYAVDVARLYWQLLGERLCKKTSPLQILIFTEILGLLALVFPWYGLLHHSIPALLVVQCAEALFSGISYSALALLFKRGLHHEELPAATVMETIIFASQVLLGTGLGVYCLT